MKEFEKITSQNRKRWFIPIADEALLYFPKMNGKILDVGCGPGFLAKELAKRSRNLHVTCIDISPYAIRLAQKNCSGLSNVTFKIGDVCNLPFPQNSFDLVTCRDSLHHFSGVKRALKEMIRVLREGKILYIQDLQRNLPQYLLGRAIPPDTIFKKLQFYSTRASYTKKELANILEQLDVKKFKIRTRNVTQVVRRKYRNSGIDIDALRESFQAHYIAVVKKS